MPIPQKNMIDSPLSYESSPSGKKLYTESTVDNKKLYTCVLPNCGKSFKFKSEMNRHLAVHSDTRPYPCLFPNCGKSFKRADALSNHSRTHSQTTSFTCPEDDCGRQFVTKSALRYHLLKHNGEKVFNCSHPGCEKSFMTQAQLRQHERASTYHKRINNSSPNQGKSGSCYSPDETSAANGETTPNDLPVVSFEDYNNQWNKPEETSYTNSYNINTYSIPTRELKDETFDSFNYLEHVYGSNGPKQVCYNERVSTTGAMPMQSTITSAMPTISSAIPTLSSAMPSMPSISPNQNMYVKGPSLGLPNVFNLGMEGKVDQKGAVETKPVHNYIPNIPNGYNFYNRTGLEGVNSASMQVPMQVPPNAGNGFNYNMPMPGEDYSSLFV